MEIYETKEKFICYGGTLPVSGTGRYFVYFVCFLAVYYTLRLSTARTAPLGEVAQYVGLQNFIDIFTDSDFWYSLLISFEFAAMMVVFSIVIGFILAIASMKR